MPNIASPRECDHLSYEGCVACCGPSFAILDPNRVRPGIVAFAEALATTLRLIVDEWTWLHDIGADGRPACAASRQECLAALNDLARHHPGLHPELVDNARAFGNYWTA